MRLRIHSAHLAPPLASLAAVAMLLLSPGAVTPVMADEPAGEDRIARGRVLYIEANEIYFDIAEPQGIEVGARVRIKRPIQLRHPVTGRMVTDWLPVGAADITAVGSTLSMARLEPALLQQVAVGDIVESLIEGPDPMVEVEPTIAATPAPAAAPAAAPALAPALDPHTRAVLATWNRSAGQPLAARIAAWEEFLATHPDSPYAAVVREDLGLLRAHRDTLAPAEIALEEQVRARLAHRAPTRAHPAQDLDLRFLAPAADELAAAWLHYRPRGASSYTKTVLRREGGDTLRARIPAAALRAPGIEYFVEIADRSGRGGAAVATPDTPIAIEVAGPPLTRVFDERRHHSRVTLSSTYLDFATFDVRSGRRTDAFFAFEADFLFRVRSALYGIRNGFGVLSGRGGFADRKYDDGQPVPETGFNYGYTELELRGPYRTALRTRLVAGVGPEGFGMGVEGRLRLGPEDGTNLSLGASHLAQIGFLTEIRMQWDAMAQAPLGLAVAVTDQPSQGDLGVRLTTDVGYRALSWLQPTLRISYQARTVRHSGIGAGLGLVFDW